MVVHRSKLNEKKKKEENQLEIKAKTRRILTSLMSKNAAENAPLLSFNAKNAVQLSTESTFFYFLTTETDQVRQLEERW